MLKIRNLETMFLLIVISFIVPSSPTYLKADSKFIISADMQIKRDGNFLATVDIINPEEPQYADWIAISDRAGLEAIANNLSGKYYLTDNINLSGYEWIPIGDNSTNSNSSRFTGIFDGQGYVISGLTITCEYEYAGLFGYASDATIKNVGLEGTCINIGSTQTAQVGGICGAGSLAITISNCYNMGDVSASAFEGASLGGIFGAGYYDSVVDINKCYNKGNVSISASVSYNNSISVGGICGANYGSISVITINNCYNTGAVSIPYAFSDSAYAGGVCGSGNSTVVINNCYNTGEVSVFSEQMVAIAGGIFGEGSAYSTGSVIIGNCYNTGSVFASSNADRVVYAGGICGSGGDSVITISNCYNVEKVIASSASSIILDAFVGGIYGYGYGSITTNNCYWNCDSQQIVNGNSQNPKRGIGQGDDTTTALFNNQMNKQASFSGFNFETVWEFRDNENNGYPILRVFTRSIGEQAFYTISYDANGGTGAPSPQTKTHDATLTLSSIQPSRTGYTFLGWATMNNAINAQYQPRASYTNNVNVTLYAVWQMSTYTIDTTTWTGGTVWGSGIFRYGETVTLIATPYSGYTFVGWYENNMIISSNLTYSFSVSKSRTLEARFTSNSKNPVIYTVSFNQNGGTGSVSYIKVELGKKISKPTNPKRTGYIFDGWYKGATKWDFNNTLSSDMKLTAKWIIIKGSIIPKTKTIKKGRKIKLTIVGNATIKKVQWKTSKKANVKIVSGAKKKIVKLKGIKKGKSTISAIITFVDGTKKTVKRSIRVK